MVNNGKALRNRASDCDFPEIIKKALRNRASEYDFFSYDALRSAVGVDESSAIRKKIESSHPSLR